MGHASPKKDCCQPLGSRPPRAAATAARQGALARPAAPGIGPGGGATVPNLTQVGR